ncbi:sister chromatid cohesion protein PDS5 homolog D [Cornus florida]|uniref:sister chromatid cohesion protein PDS5 homolog D n=1 Tax=Cornus florida TaxID=4283 RepID=UPI0028A08BC8|nr:sister chromatid cohesion protein PDS5 homolog D [Cornus florida]
MASSSSSSSYSRKELQKELRDSGNKLLMPPSSVDELLNLLDKLEIALNKVKQIPSQSMLDAVVPSMKALIANELLRHPDIDVKISVVSCISEISRITAPEPPYNDDQMKEIFQLTVMAFEKLSNMSGRCYTKAISILHTLAQVRSVLVMLDLECNDLIVEMFKHFLRTIRSNHPDQVFLDMETVMTTVLEESEEISMELVSPLLTSVKKENQKVSPVSWKLGVKVIRNCAASLKPYLRKAGQTMGTVLSDFAEVVVSICQGAFEGENLVVVDLESDAIYTKEIGPSVDESFKSVMNDRTTQTRSDDTMSDSSSLEILERDCQTEQHEGTDAGVEAQPENSDSSIKPEAEPEEVLPKKRGRKPNSLIKPEEGYDHSWITLRSKSEGKIDSKNKPAMGQTKEETVPSLDNVFEKKEDGVPKDPEGRQESLGRQMVGKKQCGRKITSEKHVTEVTGASFYEGSDLKSSRPKRKGSLINHEGGLDLLSVPKGGLLSDKLEEKASRYADVSLKKKSECARESKTKPAMGSSKNVLAAKSKKHVTEESRDKKKERSITKQLAKDENHLHKVSKKSCKRKNTQRKDEVSEMLPGFNDYGEQLVGCTIRVWWPMDQMFYEGVISSFDPLERKHKVLYADGDEEILNLCWERWELVGMNILPDRRQEKDVPSPDAISDMQQKKGTTKSKTSMKQEKMDNLSKRGGASAGRPNVKATKSGRPTDVSVTDALNIVDKLGDDTSEPSRKLNDGQKFTSKSKAETPMTIPRIKRGTSQIVTRSEIAKAGDASCIISKCKNTKADSESNTNNAKQKHISSQAKLGGDMGKEKLTDPVDTQETETPKPKKQRGRLVKSWANQILSQPDLMQS